MEASDAEELSLFNKSVTFLKNKIKTFRQYKALEIGKKHKIRITYSITKEANVLSKSGYKSEQTLVAPVMVTYE
jgi:hypothetical protein